MDFSHHDRDSKFQSLFKDVRMRDISGYVVNFNAYSNFLDLALKFSLTISRQMRDLQTVSKPFEAEDEGYELVNDRKQVFEMDGSEHEDRRDETAVVDSHSKESRGEDCRTLVVRMYFDPYDDAYNFK